MDMAFKVKGLILKDYAVASAKPKRDLPWSRFGHSGSHFNENLI